MQKYRKDPQAISRLSPEQYRVTQKGETEHPGSGEYLYNTEPGIYVDVVLGEQDYLLRNPGGYSCHFVRPQWKLPARS